MLISLLRYLRKLYFLNRELRVIDLGNYTRKRAEAAPPLVYAANALFCRPQRFLPFLKVSDLVAFEIGVLSQHEPMWLNPTLSPMGRAHMENEQAPL